MEDVTPTDVEKHINQNDGENGSQDDDQDVNVTTELLHKRLEHASLCSCLMEQGARWHLIRVGALEETEEDAPFFPALAACEEALTAHPEEFAAVVEDTLWLLDSTPEGGLAPQFLQAGLENTLNCRSLVFDGETVSWQKQAEQWDSPHWDSSADAATDDERQRILEMYDRLSATISCRALARQHGARRTVGPNGTVNGLGAGGCLLSFRADKWKTDFEHRGHCDSRDRRAGAGVPAHEP